MKIKDSLNYIILIGFFLFISVFSFIQPVHAQQGFNTWYIPMVLDNNTLSYDTSITQNVFSHYIDPGVTKLFSDGVSKPEDKYMYLPIPTVIRQQVTDTNGLSGYIDNDYPDAVYTGGVSDKANLVDTGYSKQCGKNSFQGVKQASVIFYIPISDLIVLNINLGNTKSLLDKPQGSASEANFLSSAVKDRNKRVILEYCYNSKIVYNGKVATVNGKNYSRVVVGNGFLKEFQAFPPLMQKNANQFISYESYILDQGTPINPITPWEQSTKTGNSKDLKQGYRYGEFQIIDYNNPLNCDLTNPIVSTDIFGRKIIGVQTALGCLPGSFEGVFTIILRIAVGVSAFLLLILIIMNGFTLMNGNNSPDVLKKVVSNIYRGIGALFIILFAVLFLNFVGIKILDLNALGSIGLQQITGQ